MDNSAQNKFSFDRINRMIDSRHFNYETLFLFSNLTIEDIENLRRKFFHISHK